MSSRACTAPQTCLEPWPKHKFLPPASSFPQSFPELEDNSDSGEKEDGNCDDRNLKSDNNGDSGGWSFIEALTNPTRSYREATRSEEVYFHPMATRSSSTLSSKSLEMCTESLGSETGNDICENGDDRDEFSSLPMKSREIRTAHRSRYRRNRTGSFPPPLSSISGLDNVQVRPHREGGRLVIKAVTVASQNTMFRAERADGRLRLRFCSVKEYSRREFGEDMAEDGEEVSSEEDEEESVDAETEGEECDDEDVGDSFGGDMDGNSGEDGGEIGIGELPRPGRCKESGAENKGMSNLGPFWLFLKA